MREPRLLPGVPGSAQSPEPEDNPQGGSAPKRGNAECGGRRFRCWSRASPPRPEHRVGPAAPRAGWARYPAAERGGRDTGARRALPPALTVAQLPSACPVRLSAALRAAADPAAAPRGQRLLRPPSPPQLRSWSSLSPPPGSPSSTAPSLPLLLRSRENFPTRPRPAAPRPRETSPGGKGPERKRFFAAGASQVVALLAEAHARHRLAAGGTRPAPPLGRSNPRGAGVDNLLSALKE